MKASPFEKATRRYEIWLRNHVTVVERHLRHKYVKMRDDVFTFFRGTFYRWVILWEDQRKELRRRGILLPKAPEIVCIGDLHLENFGTWRDGEGRLVWGINDFDEAYPMKYMNDLVRLATSVCFALTDGKTDWTLSHQDACAELLGGYTEALTSGGKCFVLGQDIPWLWKIATHASRTPEGFWAELADATEEITGKPLRRLAKEAANVIKRRAPEGRGIQLRGFCLRRAGVGSLGRPRFVQFYTGRSGQFLREAKPVVPSAAVFARLGRPIQDASRDVLHRAVRVNDPFYTIKDGWIVRRLAFDSQKIELPCLTTVDDAKSYFRAMGTETANVHLGAKNPGDIVRHLAAQREARPHWLYEAASLMSAATERDFIDFRGTKLGLD